MASETEKSTTEAMIRRMPRSTRSGPASVVVALNAMSLPAAANIGRGPVEVPHAALHDFPVLALRARPGRWAGDQQRADNRHASFAADGAVQPHPGASG